VIKRRPSGASLWSQFSRSWGRRFHLLGLLIVALDPLTVDEGDSGANEWHQLVGIDAAPDLLGQFQQLECHGKPGAAGGGPLCHASAVPHRRERRLDGVGGPQVLPMVGGEIEEGQEGVLVLDETLHRP